MARQVEPAGKLGRRRISPHDGALHTDDSCVLPGARAGEAGGHGLLDRRPHCSQSCDRERQRIPRPDRARGGRLSGALVRYELARSARRPWRGSVRGAGFRPHRAAKSARRAGRDLVVLQAKRAGRLQGRSVLLPGGWRPARPPRGDRHRRLSALFAYRGVRFFLQPRRHDPHRRFHQGRPGHHYGAARPFSDERKPEAVSSLHCTGPRSNLQTFQVRKTGSIFMKRTLIAGAALALWACPASAQELTGTLKNIKETGAITLGFRDSSIPFSYLDDNQKHIGYAMDICYKIVDAVKKELKLDKLEVKLNPVTSATRIPLLANGTIDLECGSTTNNAERQKQVWFTNTHFLTASRFVSKKASNINSIDDLKGKSVVSTSGTTNIKQLNEANAARNLGINIIPAKDHAEAFLMVETDRAVAFVMDDILLASLVAGSKDPGAYVISTDAFSKPEPYGIMVRKDDVAFKKVVDAATAALYQSPDGKQLYDKWFMQKIPPKGLNLNVPISAELKHEFAKPSDSPDPDSYKVM